MNSLRFFIRKILQENRVLQTIETIAAYAGNIDIDSATFDETPQLRGNIKLQHAMSVLHELGHFVIMHGDVFDLDNTFQVRDLEHVIDSITNFKYSEPEGDEDTTEAIACIAGAILGLWSMEDAHEIHRLHEFGASPIAGTQEYHDTLFNDPKIYALAHKIANWINYYAGVINEKL
jgi:hypothetical protein